MLFHRKLNTFLSWQPGERGIFYRALILLPIVALRVQFMSTQSTFVWLRKKLPKNTKNTLQDDESLLQARRITFLMFRALKYSPIKGKCLSQSLVLWHLLEKQGIESQLRIGFNKDDVLGILDKDNFNSHAWVEVQGVVLNDSPDVYERFVVFDEAMKPVK